jgi:hypothetical protein
LVSEAPLGGSDAGESTPGASRSGSEIRILYGDGGKLYCAKSANDGVSWGAGAGL